MDASVAVITRTRNRPVLLRRALESVTRQRFDDWLHVIVNDGGDPAPVNELVAAVGGRHAGRCRVIHQAKSLGMEAASNVGIGASTSRYLVIHDDDDSWHPDFLAKTVRFLESGTQFPRLGGVITHSEKIIEKIKNDRITLVRRTDFNTWVDAVRLYRMLSSNIFPPISFLYRRAVLDRIGLYREDLPALADWEFNIRFLLAHEIGVIHERLAAYHHRVREVTGDYGNSVVQQSDQYVLAAAMLQNEWLRQDLESGKVGIGVLSNLGRHIGVLSKFGRSLGLLDSRIDGLAHHGRNLLHRLVGGKK